MLIVQKYGGTSVGNVERIDAVAQRVIESKKEGHDLVVVVSAMSGETNKLLDFAGFYSSTPNQREVDVLLSAGERVTSALLAIALEAKGYEAVSMSGRKAGIVTDDVHTKARIEHIDTAAMKAALKTGKIIVVAGFQGVTENGEWLQYDFPQKIAQKIYPLASRAMAKSALVTRSPALRSTSTSR